MKFWNLKKLFDSQKGFVLIEFVIALPLIILLLYGLTQSTLMIFKVTGEQANDYELEVDVQDVLTRITKDLRTASSVERSPRLNNIDTLIIKYHAIKYDAKKIIDLIDTRVYKVGDNYKLQAKRRDDGTYLNPITGDDLIVKQLKYSKLDENVIHIKLEMQSLQTNRIVKVSTAVFMPACKEMKNF